MWDKEILNKDFMNSELFNKDLWNKEIWDNEVLAEARRRFENADQQKKTLMTFAAGVLAGVVGAWLLSLILGAIFKPKKQVEVMTESEEEEDE
ncbi:hypothetical protein [Alloscardovia criceti]|uniref:hypothetical protein n=1 Tax=Alloscardovia criceti TaxID=356828 RepID=UPI000361B6BD|nr:hypothetical protein [Alloscardovia criceti]